MKILFIYSETLKRNIYPVTTKKPLYANDEIPFGISYLSSALKQHGHLTDVLLITLHTPKKHIDRVIQSYNPDVICMSTVFREYQTIIQTAAYIKKKYPAIILVAGGPHVSLNPELCIQNSFDIICQSEGEQAITELINSLENGEDLVDIQNLWIKKEDRVIKNKSRCFNQKLDSLPFPDRKMWQEYIVDNKTPISLLVGRGCPFNCTYCCNHALREVASGQYVRFRSPKNIIEEIKQILHEFPENDTIYFEVEAINVNMDYVEDLCKTLHEFNKTLNRNIFYGANIRIIPSQDINHLFSLFRLANISYINIGLESGSERVRSEIMKRNYSNEDVYKVVRTAKRYRILSMLYIMIGLSTETLVEYEETLQILKKCQPYSTQLNIFCPYPGTVLYEYCREHNLLPDNLRDLGRNVAVLDMPQFSKKEIQKQYYKFYPRLYSKNRMQYVILYLLSLLVQKYGFARLYPMTEKLINKFKEQKL
ncbi:MAG: radical SAM protein [Bacteroidales bacterium]|nr:radical SAM protein [Bacteroidales bacterium]